MSADRASLGPLDIHPEDFDWAQFGRVAEGRPWRGRKVVITGGTGFIGARLARKLALYGASVTIPTRDRSRSSARIDPDIRLVHWTPADPASVAAAFAGADTVFNLAYDVRRSGEANLALYRRIEESGTLLSEFPFGRRADRQSFAMRNRIVAGMCDAVVVIESGVKGGSMVTAEIANGYNKDVFAFPGSIRQQYSNGCNQLLDDLLSQVAYFFQIAFDRFQSRVGGV